MTPASRKMTSQETLEYISSVLIVPVATITTTPSSAVATIGKGVSAAPSTTAATTPPASHIWVRSKSSWLSSMTTRSVVRRKWAMALREICNSTISPTYSGSSAMW